MKYVYQGFTIRREQWLSFHGIKWHMLVMWATLCEFFQVSAEHKLLSEHTQDLKSLCSNLSLICHMLTIQKACMYYFGVQEKTAFMYESTDKIFKTCKSCM